MACVFCRLLAESGPQHGPVAVFALAAVVSGLHGAIGVVITIISAAHRPAGTHR